MNVIYYDFHFDCTFPVCVEGLEHTTLGKYEYTTITNHFGFVFEENSSRESTCLSFSKRSVFTMFSYRAKTQSLLFQQKFLQFH